MRKLFFYPMFVAAAFGLTTLTSACSDDNNDNTTLSEGDQYLQKVLESDADYTINPTYGYMASEATRLYEYVLAIRTASATNTVTQAMVDSACSAWKGARAHYEKSEAFLLGAASDYNIDPHIDTWPLDVQALWNVLNSGTEMVVSNQVNLLGFHGVEFILFREGQPRSYTELNSNGYDSYNNDGIDFTSFSGLQESTYALAVATDLRNSIYQLEVCWNENAPQAHADTLEAYELATTMPSSSQSYSQNLKSAGNAGSLYKHVKSAVAAVLGGDGGCAGISDEVGNTKILNPFSGADVNYIESPYSYNSLTDFWDNIQSIDNVWNGGVEGARSTYSFAAYFAKYNSTLGTKVQSAIDGAQTAIAAIPTPFVLTFDKAENKTVIQAAIDACQTLTDALNEANVYIQNTSN